MASNTSQKYRRKLREPTTPNANPEYSFWYAEWGKMRDVVIGQKQIRNMGTKYLPKYARMTDDEYSDYLNRASFYNMTDRTLNGMVGTAFLRDPKIAGFDSLPLLKESLGSISKSASSFLTFSKSICTEVIKVGRVGVLCDMAEDGGVPFLTHYLAENIMDWESEVIAGRETLTKVVLRELTRSDKEFDSYSVSFRVLRLSGGVYSQQVFKVEDSTVSIDFDKATADYTVTPTRRGVAFDYIPFVFFGPRSNETEVDKPPLLDIADLNLSHYQSTAQLEQGRWYTALPIYYAEVGANGEQADYYIAPNAVWQVQPGTKAGLIEFHGQGLIFLENALNDKENQISALGGRMITNRPDSTGKSKEETEMNARNERSLLMNVSNVLDEGFTKLLRWWAFWQDVSQSEADKIEVKFNKDFLLNELGAREFRAITLMYQEGILPIEAVYEVFQRINIIPDDMTFEEFEKALKNPESFPNNPDIRAKKEGFPDAKSKFESEEAALARERVQGSQESNTGAEPDE